MESYYAISEMARIFGISRQTLIYYDKIGLFKPAKVNEKGYRLYAPTQIPFLRLICMLSDLGISLDEIQHLMETLDMDTVVEHLHERIDALDEDIAKLERERSYVRDRLGFYDDARFWLAHEGEPLLREFPERYAVFEAFPNADDMNRPELHTTLMRAIMHMKNRLAALPMLGWGTMLIQEALETDDQLAGAGSFVMVSSTADVAHDEAVRILPAGEYLCISRWGMPYDMGGIREAMACVKSHNLAVRGNAFDFCYLDTTSYTAEHQVDFCCMQIPVSL